MGEAKRRGDFETRVEQAVVSDAIIKAALPSAVIRNSRLAQCNGNKVALARYVVQQMDEEKRKALLHQIEEAHNKAVYGD